MRYIIGGGIAGLIFAFYNPNYKIITDNIGGQNNTPFQLGPRFIHYCEDNIKLMNDLNIKVIKRKVNIGYCENKVISKKFTNEFKAKYLKITREISCVDEDCSMSSGKNSFYAIDVDMNLIIKKLHLTISGRQQFILDKVIKIDNKKEVVYCEKYGYAYLNIISTIPFKIFYSMLDNKDVFIFSKLESKPIFFKKAKEISYNMNNYDYVYFVDESYYRITKCKDYFVYESASDEKCDFKLDFGKIINGDICNKSSNIALLGRYSEWKQDIKIQNIVATALLAGKQNK